ncbi:DNA-binding protein, partial [Streptomyces sp. SID10244]|nr:DNA-binding protein [Streptomyces sp. SID10244]
GRGTVYSYVVHHAPKVPGRQLPFVVALVELDEGVRMLGELRGITPEQVRVGLPVEATYLDFPADGDRGTDQWTLYAFTPVEEGQS